MRNGAICVREVGVTLEEMIKSLNNIIKSYEAIERLYGINLTREVNHAKIVIDDLPEAFKKALS